MGLLTPKCESCQTKSNEVFAHRSGRKLCPTCAAEVDAYYNTLSKIVLSTGDIDRKYTIVQIIMSMARGKDGANAVFSRLLQAQRMDAHKLQCDAIINMSFGHNFTVENNQMILEMFSYGTAIKFL